MQRKHIIEIFGLLVSAIGLFVAVSVPEIRVFLHLDQSIPKALFANTQASGAPIEAACIASPAIARIGQLVEFQAVSLGGNGYFVYEWSGDDGVYSLYRRFSATYSTPGRKTVTVKITSGDRSILRTCQVTVGAAGAIITGER